MSKMMVVLASLGLVMGMTAHAAELTLLSGGAVEPGVHAAVHAFEKVSGHKVKVTFNTTPQIQKRVAASETFDVIIAPPSATGEFVKAGKVDASGLDIGRVGSGIVVRPGAPVPAIATADDIKKAVLEADSITFNRASTGLYFENLLKKMGVYEQIEPKAARYATGAEVMEHVLKGKGREVGFGAITEILLYKDKGLRYVGPLPAEIQNYTSYTASVMSAGTQKEAAQALVKFLGGPAGKPLFVAAGIE
jgi:molybdate transport system substrate-binding protein